MSETVYQLDVRLEHIEPAIWRTLEVPGTYTLEDLHLAIQVAMGWETAHLHMFTIGDTRYGMVDVEGNEMELEDQRAFQLEKLVKTGSSFSYEYDFGDGWAHAITVTKVTTAADPQPRCLAGARACPPEDCGGAPGYERLVRALANPKDPEHESSVEWSDGFKPEQFSIPKKGLDLGKRIEELRLLVSGGDDVVDEDSGLPKALVTEVLSLDPMQRASLIAMITASLVEDLGEAVAMIDKLMAVKPPSKRPHSTRRSR